MCVCKMNEFCERILLNGFKITHFRGGGRGVIVSLADTLVSMNVSFVYFTFKFETLH